jgi:hypothetical protein
MSSSLPLNVPRRPVSRDAAFRSGRSFSSAAGDNAPLPPPLPKMLARRLCAPPLPPLPGLRPGLKNAAAASPPPPLRLLPPSPLL